MFSFLMGIIVVIFYIALFGAIIWIGLYVISFIIGAFTIGAAVIWGIIYGIWWVIKQIVIEIYEILAWIPVNVFRYFFPRKQQTHYPTTYYSPTNTTES